MEIESRLLPCGLHVISEPPSALEAIVTLVNIAASLPSILAETVGRGSDKGILKDVELLRQITEPSRGPGCDPIRNPKVLPTGKTMHALDPQAIPTTTSMQSAKVVVNRLIERQKADNGGKYPETVALVLWEQITLKLMVNPWPKFCG
ncbi:hypothetical protein Dsin_032784 [Dipteronia sinensis]|uniref:CobN/magnesium chelatase domain-containing protein n=1 Tax=Dipteronia sinensis TaxID=43782 RepID=A0AAE0DQI2_9ROSI|nr:hypothetical protein Dsin_032784 [Dipteronia sinensis]